MSCSPIKNMEKVMADYYLKNSTGTVQEIADLGIVISDGQSIVIPKDDFDGYLTSDLISVLADDPQMGLILSTTDIGDTSGDLPKSIAMERLSMSHKWKPAVNTFASLPTIGNEDTDIRLVSDTGVLYCWKQSAAEWEKVTSNFSLTVGEYDGDPVSGNISKLIFVQSEDSVYVDSGTAYIGPPTAPSSMNGVTLTLAGSTYYSGKLSDSNVNYKSTDPAGTSVSYIINDSIFTLSTPDTSTRCNYGDKGILSVYLNNVLLTSIDLAANFDESLRESSQAIANYNTTGNGNPVAAGIANFIGSNAGMGSLQILSVQQHNNFKYYQRFSAKINITSASLLRQGYNVITLVHSGLDTNGGTQTATAELFYDNDTGSNPTVSTPSISVSSSVLNHLSGITYYSTGSVFNVSVVGNDCFDNTYHASNAPIVLSGWPGMSSTPVYYTDSSVSGVSTPPAISDVMTITNFSITQAASQISSNAQIIAQPRDPYGSYTSVSSASSNIMVNSYTSVSDALTEYFRDETYRLPSGTYSTIPTTISGLWDSTANLATYDDGLGLQVYMDELYFPSINFSSYLPASNPDYSSLSSTTNRTYYRAFKDNDLVSHASGTLRITGMTKALLYAQNIKVYIKAPTQTGWLDLTKDYNYSTFTGTDGDGCWVSRDTQTSSDFQFTLGKFYTQNSGYMIIVKIIYPSSSSTRISHMAIIDW